MVRRQQRAAGGAGRRTVRLLLDASVGATTVAWLLWANSRSLAETAE
jgi:hypothetical protein